MKAGDRVRWRPDIAKTEAPFLVAAVDDKNAYLNGGSWRVSKALLEVEGSNDMDAELLAVIDHQMAAIDDLNEQLTQAEGRLKEATDEIEEFGDFIPRTKKMLGDLCLALGFDRMPLQKTGLDELDAFVRYVDDQGY